MFEGLGNLMSGESERTAEWENYLRDPRIQAGLLSFGIEMMKPKWSPGAALPDALSAGVRGAAGVQDAQMAEDQRNEAIQRQTEEKAADRSTRLDIARMGADSRMEVATARNAAMLEGINARHRLKGELTASGLTPAEQKLYQTYVREYTNLYRNDVTKMGRPVDEGEILRKADEAARALVLSKRVQGIGALPGGGGGNGGEFTRPNSPASAGPVSVPQPAGTPKITSPNTSGVVAPDGQPPTTSFHQMRLRMGQDGFNRVLQHPNGREMMKAWVIDPGEVDKYFDRMAPKR